MRYGALFNEIDPSRKKVTVGDIFMKEIWAFKTKLNRIKERN